MFFWTFYDRPREVGVANVLKLIGVNPNKYMVTAILRLDIIEPFPGVIDVIAE